MGLYPINCPECTKTFLWFSGNHLDQRCHECRNRSVMLHKLDALAKSIDNMTDEQFEEMLANSKLTPAQVKSYARIERLICRVNDDPKK